MRRKPDCRSRILAFRLEDDVLIRNRELGYLPLYMVLILFIAYDKDIPFAFLITSPEGNDTTT